MRRQNRELIKELQAQKAGLDDAATAMAELQASANEAQANDNKVAELTERVEALSAQLAASERTAAAKESELQKTKEALAEAENAREKQDKTSNAGETFRDCADCPEMVVIPTGSFMIGSPDDEEGRRDTEGPQHRVTIETPFALGKYEVTFDEWDACVAADGCDRKPDNEGWGRGARPVINVSWKDARQYAAWLSKETGETYRFPSEAEWEYAARAGTTTRYFWGDDEDSACTYANGHDATSKAQNGFTWTSFSCDDGYAQTAPVGSFRANAFGLHDVSGNVREWVEDSWHDNYEGAPADGSARSAGKNSTRVLCGGSWLSFPFRPRSAARGRNFPDNRSYSVGFRVSRTLTP